MSNDEIPDELPEEVLEQLEKLQIVHGVRVDDDTTMEIQVAFDGQNVVFRGESGEIESMSLLCYLDFILNKYIIEMTDPDTGDDIHPGGITPGHVMCHVVRHLHEQYHQIISDYSQSLISQLLGGSLDEATKAGGIYRLDENGLTEIDLDQMEEELNRKEPEGEEDEIVIHGLHNDTKTTH